MEQKYLIGVDFGSDSVRSLLTDTNGTELASEVFYYPRWRENKYCNLQNQQLRQHPMDYLEGLEYVVKHLVREVDAGKIAAIGVDTTGSTPVAVDEFGTPLALHPEFKDNPDAMFVLWKDHTAIKEAQKITDAAKKAPVDYTMFEGGCYSAEWFWSKAWHVLSADEKVRKHAASFVEHCDWVVSELIGDTSIKNLKRSRCAAGHKALYNESWGGFPPEEFFRSLAPELLPIRRSMGALTFTPDKARGRLSEKWAEKFGLSTSTIVSCGSFDAHIGAVGAGIEPGKMVKVFGTSCSDMLITKQKNCKIAGICGEVSGSIIPEFTGLEAGQAGFGDVYRWFQQFLSYGGAEISLSALEQDAAELAIGENPVLALDWFNGRRTPFADYNLKGAIVNLTLGSTAPMVYRSLLEATLFGSRKIIEHFRENQVKIDSITGIGGIAKKSSFLMQAGANIFNLPIQVCQSEQCCALGSAIFAAVSAGIYPDTLSAIRAMASPAEKTYHPEKNSVDKYNILYHNYLKLAQSMEEFSGK